MPNDLPSVLYRHFIYNTLPDLPQDLPVQIRSVCFNTFYPHRSRCTDWYLARQTDRYGRASTFFRPGFLSVMQQAFLMRRQLI